MAHGPQHEFLFPHAVMHLEKSLETSLPVKFRLDDSHCWPATILSHADSSTAREEKGPAKGAAKGPPPLEKGAAKGQSTAEGGKGAAKGSPPREVPPPPPPIEPAPSVPATRPIMVMERGRTERDDFDSLSNDIPECPIHRPLDGSLSSLQCTICFNRRLVFIQRLLHSQSTHRSTAS